MKKNIITFLIIVSIFAVLYLLSNIDNKSSNLSSGIEVDKYDQLIKDMIKKDIKEEEFRAKYADFEYDQNFSFESIPFSNLNILNFIPSSPSNNANENGCISLSKKYYQQVYEKYLDNLDYKIQIDKSNSVIDLRVKSFQLARHNYVLTLLTDLIKTPNANETEATFFMKRCEAIKIMQNKLDDFINKDTYSRLRLKYEMKDNVFKVFEVYKLGNYLSSRNYFLDASEATMAKNTKSVEDQAEKYYQESKVSNK